MTKYTPEVIDSILDRNYAEFHGDEVDLAKAIIHQLLEEKEVAVEALKEVVKMESMNCGCSIVAEESLAKLKGGE